MLIIMRRLNRKLKNNIRESSLGISGIILSLPCFFPSVSSVKTNLPVVEYLRLLIALKYPTFLVSAYDIYKSNQKERKEINELLSDASKSGEIILLDSGNYENYWRSDKEWKFGRYLKTLKSIPHSLAFSFDSFDPRKNIASHIEKQVILEQKYSSGTVIPIIHSGEKDLLPQLISQLVDKLNPLLVAVPERQLGEGIVARAESVYKIRKILNRRKRYYPLHLLGTGNPLSILIYSICGADSFDGLEWCQTTVDHKTGLLYHFQQRDFFGKQTNFCDLKNFPYTQATLAHNLQFYKKWMDEIQKSFLDGDVERLINKYIPKPAVTLMKQKIREIFHG